MEAVKNISEKIAVLRNKKKQLEKYNEYRQQITVTKQGLENLQKQIDDDNLRSNNIFIRDLHLKNISKTDYDQLDPIVSKTIVMPPTKETVYTPKYRGKYLQLLNNLYVLLSKCNELGITEQDNVVDIELEEIKLLEDALSMTR